MTTAYRTPITDGLTATRIVLTDTGSKLVSCAAIVANRILFADADGLPIGVSSLAWNGNAITARLLPLAQTASANTAPIKFSHGTLMSTPQGGAVEMNSDDLYWTILSGNARKGFILNDGTNLTTTRVPFATTNGRLTDDAAFTFTVASGTLAATQFSGGGASITGVVKVGGAGSVTGLTAGRLAVSASATTLQDYAGGTFDGTTLVVPACTVGGFSTYQIITANTTLYIATTGNDTTGNGTSGTPWLTVAKAMSYLAPFAISSSATVTIQLADGTYSITSAIDLSHAFGSRILLTGTNTYTKSMTSCTCSGGTGNWSIVMTLNNVTNIAVNDYVVVTGCSGGTNPGRAEGCHKVTGVAGSTITVKSLNLDSSGPTGNVISSSVTVLKSIISSSAGALSLTNSKFQNIENLALVGASISTGTGLSLSNSKCTIGPNLGINTFNIGIDAVFSSTIVVTGSTTAISGCNNVGYLSEAGSNVSAWYIVVSGCVIGFWSLQGGIMDAEQSRSTGNTTSYQAGFNGYIRISGYVTGGGNVTFANPTVNTISGLAYIEN
jgi:hypothetical protein